MKQIKLQNTIVKLLTLETTLENQGPVPRQVLPACSLTPHTKNGGSLQSGTKILDIWAKRSNNDRLFVTIAQIG